MASSKWEARNERARSLGYESYYDYRAHGYGRDAPSSPRASGEDLARLRGHRGASDLEAISHRIDVLTIMPASRDSLGRWVTATVLVELTDGTTREYTLRAKDLTKYQMQTLYQALSSGMAGGGGGGVVIDVYHMFGESDDVDDDVYYADEDYG